LMLSRWIEVFRILLSKSRVLKRRKLRPGFRFKKSDHRTATNPQMLKADSQMRGAHYR